MGGVSNRGLAPVVGVVVLIGLVIVLAAVLFVGLGGLALSGTGAAPVLGLDVEFEHESGSLVGTKVAGEDIDTDDLAVVGPGEAVFGSDQLSTGEEFEIEIHEPDGEFALVYTGDGRLDTTITRVENPIVSDLGGVPSNITMAYEDLEADESDYDYTDWVVRTDTRVTGFETENTKYAQELEIDFEPQAAHSIYNHNQSIVPDELGSGDYELTVYDGDGDEVESESGSGSFDADTEIHVMNSTDAFSGIEDPTVSAGDDELQCTTERTATLTLDLDSATRFQGDAINETTQHGSALPYDPVSEPDGDHLPPSWDNTVDRIESGDPQMLTVQENWEWPDDSVHIADAYIDVDHEGTGSPTDGDEPIFTTRTWFENPDPSENLNSCD